MPNKKLADLTNARSVPLYVGIAMLTTAIGLQAGGWSHWLTIGWIYGVGFSAFAFFWYIHNDPKPNIAITASVPMPFQHDGMKFYHQYDGRIGNVVWVTNLRTGSETPPATEVVGMLQFYDKDGTPHGYYQRAYWMDTEENHTTIKVGIIKELILGTFADGDWCVFPHTHEDPLPSRTIFPKRIPIRDGLRVTISISSEMGSNFAQKTFAIDAAGVVTNFEEDKKVKPEYHEGPEALHKFEDGMKKLFKAIKPQSPFKPSPAKPKEEPSKD